MPVGGEATPAANRLRQQEQQEQRRKHQPWNASTRLPAAITVTVSTADASTHSCRRRHQTSEQRPSTQPVAAATSHRIRTGRSASRAQPPPSSPNQQPDASELLERAVSNAVEAAATGNSTADTALRAPLDSMEWPRRERSPARSPVRSSTAPTQFEIERLLTEQTELWARHDQRCYDRKTDQRHLDEQQRRDDEFVRTMSVARFEYEQRKCRTKALQARLERDVQFLQASLEDVKRREKLLDDAFEAFVTELRIKHKQPAPSA